MFILSTFAIAAVILAALGLYGVTAFWVTQRTREIGVVPRGSIRSWR